MRAVVAELQQVMGEIIVHGNYREITELSLIVKNLPALLKTRSYLVRADAYDFVAAYHLKQFASALRKECLDRNPIARTWAMGSYYDLLGKDAIPYLSRFADSRQTRVLIKGVRPHFASM